MPMTQSASTVTATAATGVHRLGTERPLAGIACMALGVSLLPLMDGLAKHLSAEFHVLQVVWARFAFHIAWLLPLLLWRLHPRELLPRNPALQVLRGGFLLGATLCFFGAISVMPLADALALLFVSPMICTLLSPWVLGERVGPWRWSAVAAGFVGALVVVRPGFGVFQWASLLALSAGLCHGAYLVTTRRLAGSTSPMITLLFTALLGLLAMSLVAPVVWTPPAAGDWLLMALMGLFAAGGHFLVIRSFDHAPAPIVAPIGYFEIVAATLVGYLAFGDFPDPWTWLGIAIIVGSGVVIALREGRTRRRDIAPNPIH
ncbi:MAG: DMT family transporter [Halofilum sp. (in: g-proteobacteria)]|nr:DMT family transporter [Halofilum sp. (in: g-proteobacteria)]